MNTMNHVHQAGLFDPRNARKTLLFGAGAVGSMTAFTLAKTGIPFEVWDADTVVSYNCPMSLFGPSHVGCYKVEAVAEVVKYLTGVEIVVHREMYTGHPLRNASVVACVDKMSARKLLWNAVRMNPSVDLFCDTRTAGAYVEVYCIEPCNPKDIEMYEATLFDEAEAAPQSCGNHGIMYASQRAASAVVANLTHFWEHGSKLPRLAERSDTLKRVEE